MIKKYIILYHLNGSLTEIKKYELNNENLKNLKIFVYQNNKNLFLEGKTKERYFFKIK